MVIVQNVSKVFDLYDRPSDRIFENLSFFSARRRRTQFWALRDVSLGVSPGEFLGVVGPNGSGKSTLLQIVSGISKPTRGRVVTQGRVAALLELGAGFNIEFTGRENVYLSGEILGLSRQEMDRAFSRIAAFAEIGDYINRPVKEYSSGMYVRLAFATAIHVDPEILIVDEALAVGDAIFSSRCVQKLEELKDRKVTVLFVSHDLGLVKRLSDRAILMVNGRIFAEGAPSDVVNEYVGLVHDRQKLDSAGTAQGSTGIRGHGDGTSRILDIALLDQTGESGAVFRSGDAVTVAVRARFRDRCVDPVVGILLRSRLGMDVFGTNSKIEGQRLGTFEPGDILDFRMDFVCDLARQEYTLTAAVQHWNGLSQDWRDDVLSFAVVESRDLAGVANLKTRMNWNRVPAVLSFEEQPHPNA